MEVLLDSMTPTFRMAFSMYTFIAPLMLSSPSFQWIFSNSLPEHGLHLTVLSVAAFIQKIVCHRIDGVSVHPNTFTRQWYGLYRLRTYTLQVIMIVTNHEFVTPRDVSALGRPQPRRHNGGLYGCELAFTSWIKLAPLRIMLCFTPSLIPRVINHKPEVGRLCNGYIARGRRDL